MKIHVKSALLETGQRFPTEVKLLDSTNSLIDGADDPVKVRLVQFEAQIANLTNTQLLGTHEIPSVGGVATFTDLTIHSLQSRSMFKLNFSAHAGGSFITGLSQIYQVIHSKPDAVLLESFLSSASVLHPNCRPQLNFLATVLGPSWQNS